MLNVITSKTSSTQLSRSDLVQSILNLNGEPYSLKDYPHMVLPMNINPSEMVLHFSRQCVWEDQELNLSNGKPILTKDLKKGDWINSFDVNTLQTMPAKVADVWSNGIKPVYQVKTRTGREFNVTGNHPIWTAFGWKQTGELIVGDLIGLAKTNHRALTQTKIVEDWQYKIVAYLLAEGGISKGTLSFTTGNKKSADELNKALIEFNPIVKLNKVKTTKYQYYISGAGKGNKHPLKEWLQLIKILGESSTNKHHPEFIWELTKEQIQDYLRIWWDTDGYISIHKNGTYAPGIALISKQLVKGIQELLLKLGIHSTIRQDIPKIYKGTNKIVYILTIEGNESKQIFFNSIRSYKQPTSFYFKSCKSNNLVIDYNFVNKQLNLLSSFIKKPKILIKSKLNKTYNSISNMLSLCDKNELLELRKLIASDIIFDKVKSVKVIGEFETKAIEIEGTHTFQIDNILTSNTSKSVTLAARMVGDAISKGHLKQMYVSPTVDQTKLFSNDRIRPFIETSDFIKKYYLDSRLSQNVFTKEFKNFSKIYLRYALHDADKLRGFSIDKLMFDEVQDLRAGIIDVVEETMSRSHYQNTIYTGTPKRSKGTLANIWHRSTMNEYAIKCGACNHWNILDDKNIGKAGVICSKCGSDKMELERGQWVSSYSLSAQPKVVGFRICALHFAKAPWVIWDRDIIRKMEVRSQQLFFNETLALEYDGGTVPITKAELYAASDSSTRMTGVPTPLDTSYQSVGGIDYGPTNSEVSNTVMVIVQRRPGYYYVPYAKKFLGKEGEFSNIHDEVPKVLAKWKGLFLAADYGMGEASNAEIRKRIGQDKLIAFQHVNSQKERARWNGKLGAFTLNRTESITLIFNALKKGIIRFPSALDMDLFFEDILNIYAEYDEEVGTLRYVNSGPDDFFHALLYAIFASDMHEGQTMLFTSE